MDGPPQKGAEIPLRLYLKPYAKQGRLTPTMKDIAKRFSVRYFLHGFFETKICKLYLVKKQYFKFSKLKLMDEDDRTYYKQQEITLWRKPDNSMGLNTYQHLESHENGENGDAENENEYNGEEAEL